MSTNQKPEQSLWENVHQASKIYILPNSFTAGNLFFGFLSIILCVQGKFNADSTDRTIDHIAALITPNYTAVNFLLTDSFKNLLFKASHTVSVHISCSSYKVLFICIFACERVGN